MAVASESKIAMEKKPFYLVKVSTNQIWSYNPYKAKRPDMTPIYEKDPPIKIVKGIAYYDAPDNTVAGFEVHGDAAESLKAVEKPKEPEKPAKDPKTIEAIVEAIPNLKMVHYTSSGLPRIDSLSAMLGTPVSGEERDEAWGIYLEMKSIVGDD